MEIVRQMKNVELSVSLFSGMKVVISNYEMICFRCLDHSSGRWGAFVWWTVQMLLWLWGLPDHQLTGGLELN